MPEYMDVHFNMKGITPEDLMQAHQADLDVQDQENANVKQAWGDPEGAIAHMEGAYAARRGAGELGPAIANALWLSREFAAAFGNASVSAGWYARAEGLLRETGDVLEQGWFSLTRAERSDRPAEMAEHGNEALETARRLEDRDLEAAALSGSATRRSRWATSWWGWRRWTRPSRPRPVARLPASR